MDYLQGLYMNLIVFAKKLIVKSSEIALLGPSTIHTDLKPHQP